MRTMIHLFALLFLSIGVTSCYTSIPLESKRSENNETYTISYLFEHDGCRVYRFYDNGHDVYFTTRGDVTAIKRDSTHRRTVTISSDSAISIKKEVIR